MTKTAFFTDERTFWHTGGAHALFFPVGGWVQPPSSAGYAESPDSKRRLLSLVYASGLAARLDMHVVADSIDPDLDAIGALELDRRILGQRAGVSGANPLFRHLTPFLQVDPLICSKYGTSVYGW